MSSNKHIEKVSEKTGLSTDYIITLVAVLIGLFFISTHMGRFAFVYVIILFYPAYRSFQALETKTRGDDVRWLTYWIVFGSFAILNPVIDYVFHWLPLAFVFKAVFFLFILSNKTKGYVIVYEKAIFPVLSYIDKDIENVFLSADYNIKDNVLNAKKAAMEKMTADLLKDDVDAKKHD